MYKKEVEGKIKKDYEQISKNIESLLFNESKNYKIMDPDFSHPTCDGPALPLNHPDGLLRHYIRARNALEYFMTHQKIPKGIKLSRLPQYLE